MVTGGVLKNGGGLLESWKSLQRWLQAHLSRESTGFNVLACRMFSLHGWKYSEQ